MTAGADTIDVLHVDDDPGVTEVASRFLQREDPRIEVETATRGEEALDYLEDGRFDCVVSDYDMPGMDGLELFEAVREAHPDVPFILFTGKGNEAVAGEAVTAGVTDYLQKSTDTEQYGLLANRITNAVSGSRTERELEAERRRFRALFENFPEPTVAYTFEDGEPYITAVNEAFTEVFGYDESTAVGERAADLLVPPDRLEEAERLDDRVKDGARIDEHLRRETADGIRDFRFRNIHLPDDERIDGYAIYADITERERRRRERRRRNDLFRQAQELADVGAWEYDPQAGDLEWTEAVYEIYGVPSTFEPTLESSLSFYPPDDRERIRTAVERATTEGESFEETARIEPEDGDLRWVHTHGRPAFEDGEVVRVRGAIQDVTEREEQLETIRQLQYRAGNLIREGDRDRVAEIAVQIAREVLDLPFAGVHLPADDPGVLEPVAVTDETRDHLGGAPRYERNDPDRAVDRLNWGVLESGEPAIIGDAREHPGIDPDETPTRSGVVYPLGDHGVFVATAPEPHAISETDRYLVDILATVLTAALDRAERERALREQKALLEARTDRLDDLVSVISHDLRSPLNVADGRLDLARTDCDSRHLDDAASAVERSRAIVDDLLALARKGDRDAEATPITLPSIVEDCWVSVETGRATLEVETDRVVLADHDRFRHLLENLIRNAVEHGPPDPPSQAPEDAVEHGSTSNLSSTDDAIEHSTQDDEASLTVTVGVLEDGFYVADDGVGIPPDEREAVFESGYTSGDGTGLGLSIVEEVAREHDWDITLTESADGGARFEFTGVSFPEP